MATVNEVRQQVEQILASAFREVFRDGDAFVIHHGSASVHVQVEDHGRDPMGNPSSLVRIWASLAQDVPPSPEFFEWAVTEPAKGPFGRIAVGRTTDRPGLFVLFEHVLLADQLDAPELLSSAAMIAVGADLMDDVVIQRFGGRGFAN